MERLGIFVFYDRNGIVSEYVKYLLIRLKVVVTYQIVIVNGLLQPESGKVFLKMADKLVIRDNKGFDAGAYKDIFQNYLTEAELKKYDEIVLCNDSFYGPFFSFIEVWNRMKNSHADFWGFTRHPKGVFEDKTSFPAHIQSYFLTIKKSLFLNKEFHQFWEQEVDYEKEFIDAIKGFEIKFTQYFENKGFTSMALTEIPGYNYVTTQFNENPYLLNSYELISERIIPVLKRKSLLLSNNYLKKALQAYDYICEKTSYPEQLIINHIRRLNREGHWCDGWDLEKLEQFYLQHKKLYIYGAGQWGNILQSYFEYRRWTVSGIFVSQDENITGPEQVFHSDILEDTDGIVIALGKKNVKSVVDKLRDVLQEQQLFFPNYK